MLLFLGFVAIFRFCCYFEVLLLFLGVDNIDVQQQLECLSIAKEALVSKENLADDAIGDEEWNVISSSRYTKHKFIAC